jgi:hypothetical protein
MQVINLKDLADSAVKFDHLQLTSLEGDIYYAFLTRDGNQKRVVDDQGASVIFRSVSAAIKCFEHLSIDSASLLQRSAYDEMVGQPAGADNLLEIPLSIRN